MYLILIIVQQVIGAIDAALTIGKIQRAIVNVSFKAFFVEAVTWEFRDVELANLEVKDSVNEADSHISSRLLPVTSIDKSLSAMMQTSSESETNCLVPINPQKLSIVFQLP